MDLEPLSPINDFVFKKVFGEHLNILGDFLRAVLDLPTEEYKDLTVLDPNLEREYLDDKLGVLDVKVTTGSGQVLDIEVQVKPQRSIWKRMLFYTSKMVVEQVKSGKKYDKINKTISILITDFVMIQENSAYRNCFRLHDEKTGAHFQDLLEINVLEIPKLNATDGTQLGNWMRFFGATTEEDFMNAAQTSPAIPVESIPATTPTAKTVTQTPAQPATDKQGNVICPRCQAKMPAKKYKNYSPLNLTSAADMPAEDAKYHGQRVCPNCAIALYQLNAAASKSKANANEAWGVIKILSGDERARALAEAREKHLMDMASYAEDARYEGKLEGKLEVARNALREKMPLEIIAKLTGLSLDEIKRLAADLS